jgi:hypothetical protein
MSCYVRVGERKKVSQVKRRKEVRQHNENRQRRQTQREQTEKANTEKIPWSWERWSEVDVDLALITIKRKSENS